MKQDKPHKTYTEFKCEKLQTLVRELKKDLSKCRDIPFHELGLNVVNKISILPNLIYKFNPIPIKISANYFIDSNKLTLKFIWKAKDQE